MKLIIDNIGYADSDKKLLSLDLSNRLFLFTGNDYWFFKSVQKLMKAFFNQKNILKFILKNQEWENSDKENVTLEDLNYWFSLYRNFIFKKINKKAEEHELIHFSVQAEESDLKIFDDYMSIYTDIFQYHYRSADFALFNRLVFSPDSQRLDFIFLGENTSDMNHEFVYGDYVEFFGEVARSSYYKIAVVTNNPEALEAINLIYVTAKAKIENNIIHTIKEFNEPPFKVIGWCNKDFVNMQGFYANIDNQQRQEIKPLSLTDKGFDLELLRQSPMIIKSIIDKLGGN